jgi:hypothetical protein
LLEKNECAVNRVSSGKKGHGSVRAGTVAGRSNNPSTSQDLLKSLRKTEGFVNGILSWGENKRMHRRAVQPTRYGKSGSTFTA